MKLARGTLRPFAKYCLYSGIFAVFSFAFFAMVYHFANPEAAKFVQAVKSNRLSAWFALNFSSCTLAFWSVLFLLATIVSATLGFATGIFAKVFNDKAAETLKAGIET